MKIRFLHYPLFFFTLLVLFSSCSNDRIKSSIEGEVREPDNEVINQTIESVIDSLNSQIKIDLGEDYLKYKTIYVADSLRDFGEYLVLYKKAGVAIDSINYNKKNKSKLELLNKALKGGKEVKFVSSYKEYSALVNHDSVNRVLLFFSLVHFNKKFNEGVFTVVFSTSFNSGLEYAVYVKKENDKWMVKRIIESAIR